MPRLLGRGAVLSVERAHSVVVVGPSQSGKTSAIAIPAILGWPGPVLAASVKADLLRDTIEQRRQLGQVWCFDPTASGAPHPSGWSPLDAIRGWDDARRVAADLTAAAQGAGSSPDAEFWYAMAAKLLAPLLLAAAEGRATMADVVRWVDTQEVREVTEILVVAGAAEALDALQASLERDERQRSSVSTTAEAVLEPFAADRTSFGAPRIDVAALLGGAHTLYVCAPTHDQRRWRAMFGALVQAVVDAAFTLANRSARGRLGAELLVVLDEAANIAPLADLDALAATCASHGIQLVTVFQDLAQIAVRYGERSATVVNNHRAKLFLPGISDPRTLEHASRLIGSEEVTVPSVTRDPGRGRSVTLAPTTRPLLAPEALRCLRPGTAVLVYGGLPPARLELVPWWEQRPGGPGPGRYHARR
jgi:type IV secretion system protein VirD4